MSTDLSKIIKWYKKANYEIYRTRKKKNFSDEQYIEDAFKKIVSSNTKISYIYHITPRFPNDRKFAGPDFELPDTKEAKWYLLKFDYNYNVNKISSVYLVEMIAIVIRHGNDVVIMFGDGKGVNKKYL